MYHLILAALLAGGMLAGCSASDTRLSSPKRMSDERACLSYGYKPGTTGFTACVQREADLRRRGVMPDYDEILVAPTMSLAASGERR